MKYVFLGGSFVVSLAVAMILSAWAPAVSASAEPVIFKNMATSVYSWTNATAGTAAERTEYDMAVWEAITSSDDGIHLAAVEMGGDIWTSPDGGNSWVNVTEGNAAMSGQNWHGIASSSDGSKIVAIVLSGDIWTSADGGASWTNETTGDATMSGRAWSAVASSADGSRLAAGAYGSGDDIWTSADGGVTWTNRTAGTAASGHKWQSITMSDGGVRLTAAAYFGDIWTSNDGGVTWTNRTAGTAASGSKWEAIASSADGTQVATLVYWGDVWTSSDSGATWSNMTTGNTTLSGQEWVDITLSADGSTVMAASKQGGIWVSTDKGVTWTNTTKGDSAVSGLQWSEIASSSDGKRVAATPGHGDIWTGRAAVADTGSGKIPNNGDANGDGVQDSIQSNLTGMMSPITNKYVTVQADSACTVGSLNISRESSLARIDNIYDYPAGLMAFTVTGCGVNGFTTTITQYYYGAVDAGVVARKYNSNTKQYATISDVTIAKAKVGGQQATKVTYLAKDGGALDEDGMVNGTIVDPVGLATLTAASAPDTGLERQNMLVTAGAALLGLGMIAANAFPVRIRKS